MTDARFCRRVAQEIKDHLDKLEQEDMEGKGLYIPFRPKSYQRISRLLNEIEALTGDVNIELCEETKEVHVSRNSHKQ